MWVVPALDPVEGRSAQTGDAVGLSVAVAGQFPGSPVTLDYALRIRHGKISTLTIE